VDVKLLDYLVAAVARATARGFKGEAEALAGLYQAAGAAVLMPERGDTVRLRTALEGLARVNPRRARAIRPSFEGLLHRLEAMGA